MRGDHEYGTKCLSSSWRSFLGPHRFFIRRHITRNRQLHYFKNDCVASAAIFRSHISRGKKTQYRLYFYFLCKCTGLMWAALEWMMNNPPVGIRGERKYRRSGGFAEGFGWLMRGSLYSLIGLLFFFFLTLTYPFQSSPAPQLRPDGRFYHLGGSWALNKSNSASLCGGLQATLY